MSNIELPKQIDKLYSALKELPPFRDENSRKAFTGYLQEMNRIHQFNNVKKYRVVFIGAPGIGKTTAICNWLGLLKTNKKGADNIDAVNLVKTAQGRTTVSEVHIRQITDNSNIQIECMPVEKQNVYIADFCRRYYSITKNIDLDPCDYDDNETNSIEEETHEEIDRVIRNMAGLETMPSETDSSETANARRNRIQLLMRHFQNVDEFTEYVLKRIDLEKRTAVELVYDGRMKFENWLSKYFSDINYGKYSGSSIVEKLYINISQRDLDLGFPEYVKEVIDTMGLESGVRPDLQELLLAKDTVCFILDNLAAVPSTNVKNLLRRSFFSQDYSYNVEKTAIFVRCSLHRLASVNEANGDAEKGKENKLNEIIDKIRSENIQYQSRNTVFLDPCIAYHEETRRQVITNPKTGRKEIKDIRKIDDYDTELADIYRQSVNDTLQQILQSLQKLLQTNALEIRSQVSILLKIEKEAADRKALAEAHKELNCKRENLIHERKNFVPRFREEIVVNAVVMKAVGEIHWRTVRKMNSLFGAYKMWHTDIYTQIQSAGKECFADAFEPVCTYLEKCLLDIRSPLARSMASGYINRIKDMEREETIRIGNIYLTWALEEKFAPQSYELPFWVSVNQEHGKGYHNRVINLYYQFIKDDRKFLVNTIQQGIDRIVDEVIGMLSQS